MLTQITPELLRAQASEVRKYKTEQDQIMKQLRKLILSLNEDWKGEAQTAFVEKFNSMDYALKDLKRVIEEYACLMETAAREAEEKDRCFSSMIQNIRG